MTTSRFGSKEPCLERIQEGTLELRRLSSIAPAIVKPAALLLVTLLPLTMYSQVFTCTTNNGAITITGYTDYWNVVSVSIPSTVNGWPVTRIADQAFYMHTNLTSVTIPNTVVDIGNWAFRDCLLLSSLTIGNSVTNIGEFAFADCYNLGSVVIGDSVVSIGGSAFSGSGLTNISIGTGLAKLGPTPFRGCPGLSAIDVAPLNASFSSADGVLFNQSQNHAHLLPAGQA